MNAAAPAATSPALRVEGLTRRFGALTAVNELAFDVAGGELFGLVGPDGAGKTTTLRMLAGVLRPTSGDATLEGVSVARDPERAKHDLAYMAQRFGLYTDLTVLENLHFYADLYGVPTAERPARFARLFHFSGLEPFGGRLAGQLSGGMKQKLALSCSLVHEPHILLLDEPTFGVDPVSRRDLWLIIHERVAQGTTVVVSTAYMDEAERFDRLAMLHEGRIVALDTPQRLQDGLADRVLVVECDRVREARVTAAAIAGVTSAAVFGETLHLRVDSAAREGARVAAALGAAGVAVRATRVGSPSLEDVFLERIGAATAGAAEPS